MFSDRRNIFLQNLAAKSTRKVVHFFPISLIGHVDFHLFSPCVAWLSSFQSSLKSIYPPKMGKLRPGFLSPFGMKLQRKNQNKESELNTVNRKFIGIGHLANTQRIYFKNARQNVLQEEVNVLINGRVSSLHIDYKHFDYVVEQAIAGDQVVYRMAIRNNILLQWASLKHSEKYHIDLLNDIIPGTVVRIILN